MLGKCPEAFVAVFEEQQEVNGAGEESREGQSCVDKVGKETNMDLAYWSLLRSLGFILHEKGSCHWISTEE